MTKHIFMLLSAAALFVCSTAIGSAREHTWEARACTEKRTALAKLEDEAPGLHAKVAKLEADYAAALAAASKLLTGATEGATTGMGGDLGVGLDVGRFALLEAARSNADNVKKQLDSAKERERYVGSQIFLLRDIIAGLGCDTPTPPVDYNAIEKHTQQYQQSQPGSQTTTSEQSVQDQSSSYTAPSTGFGPSGSSAQSPGQPGYGPGPDESGSPRLPYDQIKVEGEMGGETGGKSATPGEPQKDPKPPMDPKQHPKKKGM